MPGSAFRSSHDAAEGELDQVGDVDVWSGEHLQIMRLILLCDTDLGKRVELGSIGAAGD